jgi:hypothetical protein
LDRYEENDPFEMLEMARRRPASTSRRLGAARFGPLWLARGHLAGGLVKMRLRGESSFAGFRELSEDQRLLTLTE